MIYLQALLDGILLGGIYGTVAMGLSLCYGVMGIINWAHGECLMVAMFISYVLIERFGMDPYVTILFNVVIMFAVGYLLQKFLFSSLLKKEIHSREPTSILLSTAGMGMILWNVATMIFSSNTHMAKTRYLGKTIWFLNDKLMLSVPRAISFLIAILVTVALYFFLERTERGRTIRATAQNREIAALMGINVDLTFCLAFGISLALVGVAGSLLVPLFAVYPKVGAVYSIKAFVIIVLGGQGNVRGTLLGGLIVGIVERLAAIVFTESYANVAVFALFIIVLLLKPEGLVSSKKRA